MIDAHAQLVLASPPTPVRDAHQELVLEPLPAPLTNIRADATARNALAAGGLTLAPPPGGGR